MKKIISSIALLGGVMSANAAVLDVRSYSEILDTGIVQGALHADLRSPQFIEEVKALNIPKTETVEVYCRSGVRAEKALGILKSMGYSHVKNLGGFEQASQELQRPLVKPK